MKLIILSLTIVFSGMLYSKNLQQSYLKNHKEGLDIFENGSIGKKGIPMMLFRLFPDVFPDIWGPVQVRDMGLFANTKKGAVLPYGFNYGKGPIGVDSPGLRELTTINVMTFSCTLCHSGWVRDSHGKVQKLIGAPANTFDFQKLRWALIKTTRDKRFTAKNFRKALAKKSGNFIYRKTMLNKSEIFDRFVLKIKGDHIIEHVKKGFDSEALTYDTYLKNMYKNDSRIYGGTPGYSDILGAGTWKIYLDELAAKGKELPHNYKSQLSPTVGLSDYIGVFNQGKRKWAQWDGSLPNPMIRNLISLIGQTGGAANINDKFLLKIGKFLNKLPPPSYIFAIDKRKAKEGKKIFNRTCKNCHDNESSFSPEFLGVDKQRANMLHGNSHKPYVTATHNAIKKACNLFKNLGCSSFKSYVALRDKPVYFAPPLNGVWTAAPYLHNGSVPTLYHLLVPNERPETFYRGNIGYDSKKVGFIWAKPENKFAKIYNTKLIGSGNSGHGDKDKFFGGIDFSKDRKKLFNLLEYLKTL